MHKRNKDGKYDFDYFSDPTKTRCGCLVSIIESNNRKGAVAIAESLKSAKVNFTQHKVGSNIRTHVIWSDCKK